MCKKDLRCDLDTHCSLDFLMVQISPLKSDHH
jgi:hypothetical protein